MLFLYPKIIDYAREEDTPRAHRCQLKVKPSHRLLFDY